MEAEDIEDSDATSGPVEGRICGGLDRIPTDDRADPTFHQWLTARAVCVKRKLEDLDISAAEFRPKRELREEMLEADEDGIVATLLDRSAEVFLAADGGILAPKFQDEDLNAAAPSRLRCLDNERLSCPAIGTDDLIMSNDDDRYHFAVPMCGTCSTSEGSSSFSEYFEAPHLGIHADVTDPVIQFFVRTFSDARTVVMQAHAEDTIELVHKSIYEKTGLPISEQRLIYSGRQLQQHQTLAECQVSNDATLNLVGRMLSTPLYRSWQLVNDLVATIHLVFSMTEDGRHSRLRLMQAQEKIRFNVKEFLKLAAESLPIADHMQVFQLAGATSALVVLLLSPFETNQECAEYSIKLFVSAIDDCSSTDIHHYCAPVLLEFCKLLERGAPRHALYFTCRNALACILDTVWVAHGSAYFNDAKAETIVHDFAPFVAELASKLSSSLCFTARVYAANESSLHLDAKEGHDFTAFVTPLCKAMEACRSVGASLSMDDLKDIDIPLPRCLEEKGTKSYSEGPSIDGTIDVIDKGGAETGSHAWLFAVFRGLLCEIDNFLGKVEGAIHERPYNWAHVLAVLKGLNVIAKMYEGCMETLLTVLSHRCKALNTIIQQSDNDHFWLLEHKSLLDFESKKTVVLGMLSEPQEDFEERHDIFIHRDHLLSESFHAFENVKSDILQGGLSVEFASEEATGPGVLREWFYLICRELFNPENALFLLCPNDLRGVFPNPASGVNPEHLSYFRFSGQVIALALMHRVQVNVVFASIFFRQVAGLPVTWEDVKDADPLLYESCKKILELDSELVDMDVLGLTFVYECEELGKLKTVELCHGGKDLSVNSQNRYQYVELLVQHRFVTCIKKQVECFCQGFSDLLVGGSLQQFLQALEPKEFALLLFGKDKIICADDWKSHTEYHGYDSMDCHIAWFWEVVRTMNTEQRRRLLFFSTSVAHLPANGFAGLSARFHIHRAHTDTTWLPTAHTCFFQLILPPYPSYELMYSKLYAVIEGHIFEGFGFA